MSKGKNGLEKVIELDQLPYFTMDSVCRLGWGEWDLRGVAEERVTWTSGV